MGVHRTMRPNDPLSHQAPASDPITTKILTSTIMPSTPWWNSSLELREMFLLRSIATVRFEKGHATFTGQSLFALPRTPSARYLLEPLGHANWG